MEKRENLTKYKYFKYNPKAKVPYGTLKEFLKQLREDKADIELITELEQYIKEYYGDES